MKTLELTQGSPEWLAVRAKHFNASEAPAMLGLSRYMSRSELLKQKATGIVPEVDAATQRRFDDGHEAEAAARPIAESIIGEDLFPVTGTLEVEGLPLLASFDGLTMGEDVSWENKQWNEEFAAYLRETGDAPDTHWPQLEQQQMISGAKRTLFTVSDGTEARTVSIWYESKPERRAQVIAGWKQFAQDLANYQHVEVLPEPVARPIDALPALIVEISGEVRSTNLAVYRTNALDFIASIKTDLQTDQDFADAEKTIKFCESAEQELEVVKKAAQAQSSSIDELFRTIDVLKEEMRQKRLTLDRLVKARKETIRTEILQAGQRRMAAHLAALNERLGDNYITSTTADFAGVMKGKKTVSSLKDAVATELARAQIEASAVADKIAINLKAFAELAAGHEALFPDLKSLVGQTKEAFSAMVENRVAKHKAAENERLEAERARIRQEEEARAQAATQAAATATPATVTQSQAAPTLSEVVHASAPAAIAQAIAPIDNGATIKLGEINERLGFTVSADFLASLGFTATTERSAKLYRECDFPNICSALQRHICTVAAGTMKKAA